MKNEMLIRAIGGIDEELIERAEPTRNSARVTVAPWLRWAMPVAACLVIATAIALPAILKPPTPVVAPENPTVSAPGVTAKPGDADDGNAAIAAPPALGDITGLPTGDYTWDEGEGVSADRILLNELRLLMREFDSDYRGVSAAFAIVRPLSAESFTDDHAGWFANEGQIAECEVLFSTGDEVEKSLRVRQYLYGGCTGDEETNLLRVGGVYVLPLVKDRGDEYWSAYGDLDVLFEVDDAGLVHSHSKTLREYDGAKLAVLWEDIEYLEKNPLLRSPLAENIAYGGELEFVGDEVRLFYPQSAWSVADEPGFSAVFDGDGRLDVSQRVNEGGFNVFHAADGMTREELQSAVDEIKLYLGSET